MRPKNATLAMIGRNIRAVREELGLTQEGLALLAQLDRTYIGGVERGERNISVLNLCRIAQALNVEPAIFLESVSFDGSTQENM